MILIRLRKTLRALGFARDRRALRWGIAASFEHAAVLQSLPRVGTIVDIGANRGQFILEAVKWHPDARIVAFEPLSMERAAMMRVLAGLPNLTVYPVALGDDDTTTRVHVAASADSSSVLKQTPLQAQTFPGTETIGTQDVSVRRLDHLIDFSSLERPIVCKIDVQGYELKVLEGFGSCLEAVDYLIIELSNVQFYQNSPNSAEVISFLATQGFNLINIYNMYYQKGVCLQADFLFGRKFGRDEPS